MKLSHCLAVLLLLALATACAPAVSRPAPAPTATDVLVVPVTLGPRQAPALTAAPPLPLPPATPLPTPTPTIYVVQSGDTLLGIALKYGVSLAALQAANGNVQPEFLQIGQALVIPLGQPEPAGQGGADLILPTPTPQPVQLAGVGLHETPTGSLWVMGELYNPTGDYIAHVQLDIVLVGPGGERLGETVVFPALDLVAPGGRVPFGALFPARPQGMASYHVDVLSAEAYTHDGPFVPAVRVTSETGGPSGALFRVTGVLHNDAGVALTGEVVVTLYDDQGIVVGFERESSGALAPGADGPFDVRVAPAGAGTTRYAVAAQGVK